MDRGGLGGEHVGGTRGEKETSRPVKRRTKEMIDHWESRRVLESKKKT